MDIDNIFPNQKETRWVNKQRTLIVTSKNISDRIRQLFMDLHELLPHSKKETKLEKGDTSKQIKELCMQHSCRSFIYFEVHRKHELYLWIGRFPNGPSIKYYIENWHNCQDLKLTGNCMKGSRPILSFDGSFTEDPLMILQKELFIHAINVPKHHPKSAPCCDRVFSFIKESPDNNNIWIRNYEIQYEKAGKEIIKNQLVEIGPRLVLKPIIILEGCIQGAQLWKDTAYITQAKVRLEKKLEIKKEKDFASKKQIKKEKMLSKLETQIDEIENIFDRGQEQQKSDEYITEDSNVDLDQFEEVQ
ncbi:unnamed protein product [Paramecium pentaurelia]|uniref:Brix domain-containing protein n=1 Tax=Paramecium pentaurelia TaxID=43138 RepID=A0A8S1SSR9_9CILI|nr:unnamed protein product [Paramecium pentaurelia]